MSARTCLLLSAALLLGSAPALAQGGRPGRGAPPAAEAAPDARGFKEAPVPDFGAAAERERGVDLVHARIEIRLDLEAETVDGLVTHTLRSLRDDLRELEFDSEELTVRFVEVGGRKQPYRTESAKVFVDLDRPYAYGEELEARISYFGSPTVGLYFVKPERGYPEKPYQAWTQGQAEDNHHWVPIHDVPNDRTTFETFITVKEGLVAVSNGLLQGVTTPEPGYRTFHHRMDEPNSTYLIAFAVGPWERYVDVWRNRPVEYFVSQGVGEATARRSFGVTPDILEFFSATIGVEYPWPKYAQVAVAQFVVGGMENVSCTLQTDRTLHDATAALERESTGLVAHEAAHQWFGDLVTCRTWEDLWLNEGFATYYEKLYTEARKGVDDFRLSVRGSQQGYIRADRNGPSAMAADFYSRRGGRDSAHVYTKGSSVLHMLRFVLGDEAYHRSIRNYLERHRLGLVQTRDLQLAVADATGRNLEWFFEQWVQLAGHPKFEVAFDYDAATAQGNLRVKQVQETGGLVPVFRTPVDVEFVVAGRPEVRRIFVAEQEQVFSFPLAARPSRVRFDKGGWILKELTFPRSIEERIETALEDDDVIGRLEAVLALKEESDPRAREALARVALSKDHHQVRTEALEGVAARQDELARTTLMAALGDGEARVRVVAARALGKHEGREEVAELLRRTLATDAAYGPRAAAVRALAEAKAERAFEAAELALIIPSHEDEIARAALGALVDVDAAKAAPYVVTAATYGVAIDLRHEALRLISRVAAKLSEKERAEAVEVVKAGLADHYNRTRQAALQALVELEAKEALDEIDRLAKEDRSSWVRRAAERAAERLRGGGGGGGGDGVNRRSG